MSHTPLSANAQTIQIGEREYSVYTKIADELSLSVQQDCLYELSYMAAIKVSGKAAGEFLQGQLSCDIQTVSAHQACPGAYCNAQGRIIGLFTVLMIDDNSYLLLMPRDTLKLMGKTLRRYAKFSKVAVEVCQQFIPFGISICQENQSPLTADLHLATTSYGQNQADGLLFCQVSPGRYLGLLDSAASSATWNNLSDALPVLGSLSWHQQQVCSMKMELYPSTQEQFLPHRLDLHKGPAISFNKGCYMGQEIIARTHYRAKLKHELQLQRFISEKPIAPGQSLFDREGKRSVGEVIDMSIDSDNQAIALCSLLISHSSESTFTIKDTVTNELYQVSQTRVAE